METEDNGFNPNSWQDLLLKSIEKDADSGALYNALTSVFGNDGLLGVKHTSEKSNFIKLANPEKLASDYALIDGNSVNITYKDEMTVSYNYNFKVRTKPENAGLMTIYKQKLDGKVYVEFLFGDFNSESRSYEMSEFTDFQNFMGKIIDVIVKR